MTVDVVSALDVQWLNTPLSETIHDSNDCQICGNVDVVENGKCRYCDHDYSQD